MWNLISEIWVLVIIYMPNFSHSTDLPAFIFLNQIEIKVSQ